MWKLKEEAELAEASENRKLREAGQFVPDSGFSITDDLFETDFRELILMPLSKQKMQEAVIKYYGWEKWSEDPWGGFEKFSEWLKNLSDDERAVWAINDTFGGRVYFTLWTIKRLRQVDFSKIGEKDFLSWIGVGAENFLRAKSYTGWDSFQNHYPDEPLPARFVNEQIIKVHLTCPFSTFRWFINSIYLWYFALKEYDERAKGHPELEAFLNYHTATDTQIAELCRKLAPKGYQIPDKEQAWQKVEQSLEKRLKAMSARYDDVYPDRSVLKDDEMGDNVLQESYMAAQEGLFEGVNYWKAKAAQATIAGLKGQLGNSLFKVIKNNLIDAVRQKDPHLENLLRKARDIVKPETPTERKKLRERVKNLRDRVKYKEPIDPEDKELFTLLKDELVNYSKTSMKPVSLDPRYIVYDSDDESISLSDTIEAQDSVDEEEIDLETLGLDLDKLTPKERWVMKDVLEGFREGYNFDSKLGTSFAQRWGEDYDKNIKAYNRARKNLKQP
ncbi:hypothetical protein ACFLVE_03110 [Chloroflexota bacterium]